MVSLGGAFGSVSDGMGTVTDIWNGDCSIMCSIDQVPSSICLAVPVTLTGLSPPTVR